MSTQVLGAAAAGTAVIGGGGATIAYAAGAFDPKVKESKQEVSTYKTLAEKEFETSKEYVGGDESAIKTLLEKAGDTSYKTTLKNTHWEKMEEKDILEDDKPTKTKDNEFDNNGKNDEISKYVSAWCQAVSEKELSSIPKNGETNNNRWEAFKFACFKQKP
ncbi:hypothetical protein [Candidatus Mycoplasma haematohominis]|uniref:hypothetical protein n=1 Tax=Candidatus Mycoplasma haematohominis TaxID=1494318 RepID=UPI001C0A73CA|nr:hypothetical protein [Candidatus Mycoplasma haemohominis]